MTAALLQFIAWLTIRHPGKVAVAAALVSVGLYLNVSNLRLGTNLTDLFGADSPQWKAVNEFTEKLGYGNRLMIVVESAKTDQEGAELMESAADRLSAAMEASGHFKTVKSGMTEDELIGVVRLYSWNFPFFVKPVRAAALRARLEPKAIEETVRKAASGLVTPFSTLGTRYFMNDPLGVLEIVSDGGRAFAGQAGFDFDWGSGNRFFNKDHSALLIMAEPTQPATNYIFSETMTKWLEGQAGAIEKESAVRIVPSGAYLYSAHDHQFIQDNIQLVSVVSIAGNLILCLLVYPRIPIFLMALLPTALGILWTTGIIAWHPGQVNLISLSFIAILAGLGDDQIIHFFNRVPQEWRNGRTLDQAIAATYHTTGRSVLFCVLTVATATGSLWLATLKGLAEFGLVLTVGLAMLLIHTLLTVPALMRLWWRVAPPSDPEEVTFRFLPRVANASASLLERHRKTIFSSGLVLFVLSLTAFPFLKLNRKIEISRGENDPAVYGQKRLSEKFGIEGTPEVMLLNGAHDELLERVQGLTSVVAGLKDKKIVKNVSSPTDLLPPVKMQLESARSLGGVDYHAVAATLERALVANGFNPEPFRAVIDRYRNLGNAKPLRVEEAETYLPAGMLDTTIRKTGDNQYLAAVAIYPADPNATQIVPDDTLAELHRKYGSFAEFSFDRINRDLQEQLLGDSTRALAITLVGMFVIGYFCFRSIGATVLALAPILFSMAATVAVLVVFRYPLSYMALTAFPLIVGIGIDNGIHLMRRFREESERSVGDVVRSSGAALIQSNLTTIIGFGALMAAKFKPLEEMGLVTAVGVAVALMGAMFLVPAAVLLFPALRRA
jgi:predicted RND superfamily exporter protein